MINDMDDIARGEAAKQLLEHPLFVDAISTVRNGIVATIANSSLGDDSTHHNLAIALQLLNQIERRLKEHIETGQMAAIQANEKVSQKLRRVVGF